MSSRGTISIEIPFSALLLRAYWQGRSRSSSAVDSTSLVESDRKQQGYRAGPGRKSVVLVRDGR